MPKSPKSLDRRRASGRGSTASTSPRRWEDPDFFQSCGRDCVLIQMTRKRRTPTPRSSALCVRRSRSPPMSDLVTPSACGIPLGWVRVSNQERRSREHLTPSEVAKLMAAAARRAAPARAGRSRRGTSPSIPVSIRAGLDEAFPGRAYATSVDLDTQVVTEGIQLDCMGTVALRG